MNTLDLSNFPYIIKSPVIPQIRMGIIGGYGTGKTTGALTFPNPIILDKDRKTPPGIDVIPFYDPEVEASFTEPGDRSPGNPSTALVNFLLYHAPKFPPETTFILDSWTTFMNALDLWLEDVKHEEFWSTKKGEVDGWALQGRRLDVAVRIVDAFKALKCNLVVTFHETQEWKKGVPTGGIKPIMRGQFADQIGIHLTAFFRAGWHKEFTENNGYYWRVTPDGEFTPATPAGFTVPVGKNSIAARYEDYVKCFKA